MLQRPLEEDFNNVLTGMVIRVKNQNHNIIIEILMYFENTLYSSESGDL